MNRHLYGFQKPKAFLHAVGKLVWRGREGHDRRSHHQIDQPEAHKTGHPKSFPGDPQKAQPYQHFSVSEEQVEADADQQQKYHRFKPSDHKFKRYPGYGYG